MLPHILRFVSAMIKHFRLRLFRVVIVIVAAVGRKGVKKRKLVAHVKRIIWRMRRMT